jgi:hypothetical protein
MTKSGFDIINKGDPTIGIFNLSKGDISVKIIPSNYLLLIYLTREVYKHQFILLFFLIFYSY